MLFSASLRIAETAETAESAEKGLSRPFDSAQGGGLSRRGRDGDKLLGGGDGVLIGQNGSAVGFHPDGIDQQRIIGEVDCCAEGHAGNA